MTAVLEIRDLHVAVEGKAILKGVNLVVKHGDGPGAGGMTGREGDQRSKMRVGSRNHSQVFGNGNTATPDEFLIGKLRTKTPRWAPASGAPTLQTPLTLATAAARALAASFASAAVARNARSILAKFMHSLGSTC